MSSTKTFRDDLNREWTLAITTETLLRIHDVLGFTFDSLISRPDQKDPEKAAEPLYDFLEDSVLFARVLWLIVQPDAEKKGITESQFHSGFIGEGSKAAISAFLQALADFSRHPAKKMVIRGVMERWKAMLIAERKANELTNKLIAEMTPEKVEQEIEARLKERSLNVAIS